MFFVGLSAGGLIISSVPKAFGIAGFGGISQGGRVDVHLPARWSPSASWWWTWASPSRVWELFAYSNLGSRRSCGTSSCWPPTSSCPCVYLWAHAARRARARCRAAALRVVERDGARVRGARPLGDRLDLRPPAGRTRCGTRRFWPRGSCPRRSCAARRWCWWCVIALRTCGLPRRSSRTTSCRLAKLLGAFVVVDLYFFGCDLLTEGFPGGAGAEVVAMLVSGPLAPFFWVGGRRLRRLPPSCASCRRCARTRLLVAASLLAIAGIFCKRVQLLVGGFQIANLDLPGAVTSSTRVTNWRGTAWPAPTQGMVYWPTPLECGRDARRGGPWACLHLLPGPEVPALASVRIVRREKRGPSRSNRLSVSAVGPSAAGRAAGFTRWRRRGVFMKKILPSRRRCSSWRRCWSSALWAMTQPDVLARAPRDRRDSPCPVVGCASGDVPRVRRRARARWRDTR